MRNIVSKLRQRWIVLLGIFGFALFGLVSGYAALLLLRQAIEGRFPLLSSLYSAALAIGAGFFAILVKLLIHAYRNYDELVEVDKGIDRGSWGASGKKDPTE